MLGNKKKRGYKDKEMHKFKDRKKQTNQMKKRIVAELNRLSKNKRNMLTIAKIKLTTLTNKFKINLLINLKLIRNQMK
jgi:hypothetical protein